MPKYLHVAFILMMITLSCNDDQGRELFIIPHTIDLEIVAGLNILDTHIYQFSYEASKYEEYRSNAGFSNEEVGSVTGKSAEFGAVFSDVDLDFIREISVQIYEPGNASNRREVFYLDPVPGNAGKTIHLFPALPDVKQFVQESHFGIEVLLNFRYVPENTTMMRLELLLSARE